MKKTILLTLLGISVLSCKKDPTTPNIPTSNNPTTQDTMYVMDIDSNVYNVIQIGNQKWMKENLKVSKYNDGTDIQYAADGDQWHNAVEGAYIYYDYDTNYNHVYGKMYNLYVINTNKVCPTNWHVPSDLEWNQLVSYLGGDSLASLKMKEVGGVWNSQPTPTTNESGFTALPGGSVGYGWSGVQDMTFFTGKDLVSWWWTSSNCSAYPYPWSPSGNYIRGLYSTNVPDNGYSLYKGAGTEDNGSYIRCVHN
jgi:uncharacterized protein (TIGR02145 family)